ncbi:MAG: hypothetical protein KDA24_23555 [Deltaproteobacteria bacterium]|nr:hypothetical protein [Deltaproteobacteria bacterium]
MTLKILLLVAVTGLAISLMRGLAARLGARTVAEMDLEERVTDRSVGVRDDGKLDVWIPPNTRTPSKAVRLLRGRPEPGRGLRLSLYAGAIDDASDPDERLVRTWLGPYPDSDTPVLVEVTLRVGRHGQLRVQAIDKASGRKLEIVRDERGAAPQTVITTREVLIGELEPRD